MILKKEMINDKVAYIPVEYEEAKELYKKNIELIFGSDDEKDEFLDRMADEEDAQDDMMEALDEFKEAAKDFEKAKVIFSKAKEKFDRSRKNADDIEDFRDATEDFEEAKSDYEDAKAEYEKARKDYEDETGRDFEYDFNKELDEIKIGIKELGEKIRVGTGDFSKKIKDGVNNFIGKVKSISSPSNKEKEENPKTKRILAALPFMSKKDIHELVKEILNDEEMLKEIDITGMLPFLTDKDCDALFMKTLQDNKNLDYVKIAPFVSDDCLKVVVNMYINDELPDCDIEGLYPFLPSEEIKKIFKYIMSK